MITNHPTPFSRYAYCTPSGREIFFSRLDELSDRQYYNYDNIRKLSYFEILGI